MGILALPSFTEANDYVMAGSGYEPSSPTRSTHTSPQGQVPERVKQLSNLVLSLPPHELRHFLLDFNTQLSMSAKEASTEIMWSTLTPRERLLFDLPSRAGGGMVIDGNGAISGMRGWPGSTLEPASRGSRRWTTEDVIRGLSTPLVRSVRIPIQGSVAVSGSTSISVTSSPASGSSRMLSVSTSPARPVSAFSSRGTSTLTDTEQSQMLTVRNNNMINIRHVRTARNDANTLSMSPMTSININTRVGSENDDPIMGEIGEISPNGTISFRSSTRVGRAVDGPNGGDPTNNARIDHDGGTITTRRNADGEVVEWTRRNEQGEVVEIFRRGLNGQASFSSATGSSRLPGDRVSSQVHETRMPHPVQPLTSLSRAAASRTTDQQIGQQIEDQIYGVLVEAIERAERSVSTFNANTSINRQPANGSFIFNARGGFQPAIPSVATTTTNAPTTPQEHNTAGQTSTESSTQTSTAPANSSSNSSTSPSVMEEVD